MLDQLITVFVKTLCVAVAMGVRGTSPFVDNLCACRTAHSVRSGRSELDLRLVRQLMHGSHRSSSISSSEASLSSDCRL